MCGFASVYAGVYTQRVVSNYTETEHTVLNSRPIRDAPIV